MEQKVGIVKSNLNHKNTNCNMSQDLCGRWNCFEKPHVILPSPSVSIEHEPVETGVDNKPIEEHNLEQLAKIKLR